MPPGGCNRGVGRTPTFALFGFAHGLEVREAGRPCGQRQCHPGRQKTCPTRTLWGVLGSPCGESCGLLFGSLRPGSHSLSTFRCSIEVPERASLGSSLEWHLFAQEGPTAFGIVITMTCTWRCCRMAWRTSPSWMPAWCRMPLQDPHRQYDVSQTRCLFRLNQKIPSRSAPQGSACHHFLSSPCKP